METVLLLIGLAAMPADTLLPPLVEAEIYAMPPGCEELSNVRERRHCAEQLLLKRLYQSFRWTGPNRCISGKIIATFVIEKDGTLSELETIRTVDPYLAAEFFRLLRKEEPWHPATQDGHPVRSRYTIPFDVRLE